MSVCLMPVTAGLDTWPVACGPLRPHGDGQFWWGGAHLNPDNFTAPGHTRAPGSGEAGNNLLRQAAAGWSRRRPSRGGEVQSLA